MFKTSLVLAVTLLIAGPPVQAQSLVDAAAAAKLIHEDPAWSRVITNQDLAPVPVAPLAATELPTSAIADTAPVPHEIAPPVVLGPLAENRRAAVALLGDRLTALHALLV